MTSQAPTRPRPKPRTSISMATTGNSNLSPSPLQTNDSRNSKTTARSTRSPSRNETRSFINHPDASPASTYSTDARSLQSSRISAGRQTRSFVRGPSASSSATPMISSKHDGQSSAIPLPSLRDVTPAPSFAIPKPRRAQRDDQGSSSVADAAMASTSLSATSRPLPVTTPRVPPRSTSQLKPPRGSKPAAPLSAYSLFARERRPLVEREAATPSGPRFDVNQAVRQAWNALSTEEQSPFQAESDQRRKEYEISLAVWRKTYGVADADNSAAPPNPKRDRRIAAHKPSSPKNAYQLFKSSFDASESAELHRRSGAIATAWHKLTEVERKGYQDRAASLREEYQAQLKEWREEYPEEVGRIDEEGLHSNKRRTISDDEAEYYSQIAAHGKSLSSQRLDVNVTSMAELSDKTFNMGRASDKTFDLARKLRDQRRERNRVRQRMRKMQVRTEDELRQIEGNLAVKDSPESRATPLPDLTTVGDDESEVVTDGEGMTTDEGEDGPHSDADSIGAASTSTHHTLREKQFSVRTRIVNGQIVLDESSLQQSQNDGAGISGPSTEYIDVNESERFVNSATHAKRRGRNDRWQPAETEHFLRAVSMWGTDFEMIARMFPFRDRRQIRAKWRNMERTNGHSLDLAFKTRIPVDLEVYGTMAGVDLSGEAPQINVNLSSLSSIKKSEEEGEDEEQTSALQRQQSTGADPIAEVEYYENGMEVVEEGDEDVTSAQLMLNDDGHRRRRASEARLSDMPPPPPSGKRKQQDTSTGRPKSRGRSSSVASHASTSTTFAAHGASSAAASDRQRKQRKAQDDLRKKRELARRRPQATGEEEVVEE